MVSHSDPLLQVDPNVISNPLIMNALQLIVRDSMKLSQVMSHICTRLIGAPSSLLLHALSGFSLLESVQARARMV